MGNTASRQKLFPLTRDIQVGAQSRWDHTPIGPEPRNALHGFLAYNWSDERFMRDVTYFEAVEMRGRIPVRYYRWIEKHRNLTRCNITDLGRNGQCRTPNEAIHLPGCGHTQMEGMSLNETGRERRMYTLGEHRRYFRNEGKWAQFTDLSTRSPSPSRPELRPYDSADDDDLDGVYEDDRPGQNRSRSSPPRSRSEQRQTARPKDSQRRGSRTAPRGPSQLPRERSPVSRSPSQPPRTARTPGGPNADSGGKKTGGGAAPSRGRASSRGPGPAPRVDTSRRSPRPYATTTGFKNSARTDGGGAVPREDSTTGDTTPATGTNNNATMLSRGEKGEVVKLAGNGKARIIKTTKEEKHTIVTNSREETHNTITTTTEEIPADDPPNQRNNESLTHDSAQSITRRSQRSVDQ